MANFNPPHRSHSAVNFGVRKRESLGYRVILHLAILIQFQSVTDRHTDTQTDRHLTTAMEDFQRMEDLWRMEDLQKMEGFRGIENLQRMEDLRMMEDFRSTKDLRNVKDHPLYKIYIRAIAAVGKTRLYWSEGWCWRMLDMIVLPLSYAACSIMSTESIVG